MVSRDQALRAGSDVADLVGLATDKVSNTSQIGDFLSSGMKAFQDIAGTDIPHELKPAVLSNVVEGLLTKLNTTSALFQLPA